MVMAVERYIAKKVFVKLTHRWEDWRRLSPSYIGGFLIGMMTMLAICNTWSLKYGACMCDACQGGGEKPFELQPWALPTEEGEADGPSAKVSTIITITITITIFIIIITTFIIIIITIFTLTRSQKELPARRMADSLDSAAIPLGSDPQLRDRFR